LVLGTRSEVGLPSVGVAGERFRLKEGIRLARIHSRYDYRSKRDAISINGSREGGAHRHPWLVGLEKLLTRDEVMTSCTRDSDISITALEYGQTVSRGGRKRVGRVRTWTTLSGVETVSALAPAMIREAIAKALEANIFALLSCEGLRAGGERECCCCFSTSVRCKDCVLGRRRLRR
jgi:hypothetical protein